MFSHMMVCTVTTIPRGEAGGTAEGPDDDEQTARARSVQCFIVPSEATDGLALVSFSLHSNSLHLETAAPVSGVL